MSLQTQLDQDVAASMKEGNVARTSVLRLLKSSLKNEQIKLGHELSEPEVQKVLQREAKQRKDSIAQYQAAERTDLVEAEQQELEIIENYLPDQMSEADLVSLVEAVIAELQPTDGAQIGAVIGAVMQRAEGRVDGATVAKLVRQKLN